MSALPVGGEGLFDYSTTLAHTVQRAYSLPALMHIRRLVWVLHSIICLAVLTVFLGGCKKKEDAQAGHTARKILRYGNGSEPQFLDPQLLTGSPEHSIDFALFEGLVMSSQDPNQVSPGIAEKWDVSPDGLVYTFHLRPEAKWSDGTPITSQDFLRSYQRILTPAVAADYSYLFYVVKGAEDYYEGRIKDFAQTGFSAPDDHTLVLTLRRPAPFLLKSMARPAWYPLPVHVLEKFHDMDRRDATWTRPENIVTNGAFVMKQWIQHQKIVVEKSPNYWDREHVKLDTIEFYPIEQSDTEDHMFRTGQLDITYEVPADKIATYQREMPNNIQTKPWCGVYFYRFNVARKPLNDVRVRRALSLAIDREKIVKNVTLGGEAPAYSYVPPNTNGYVPDYKIHEDVAEAKRLLAEAGFPDGHGFPHLQLIYNTSKRHGPIAEAIQEMWRRNLGIDITLANEEWKVFLDDQKQINFDIERGSWIADYFDPNSFVELFRTGSGNNFTNWGNPEYDRLLASSLDTKSEEERYGVYRKMEKILMEEQPIVPIFFYTESRLISSRVTNFKVVPMDDFPWKEVDVTPMP